MAKHNIYLNVPTHEVSKVDVTIQVYQDDEKFGTITISKGNLEWYPRSAKSPYKLSWSKLDKIIRNHYEG